MPCFLFFFSAPATPAIYTLSLHDALPISGDQHDRGQGEDSHQRGDEHRPEEERHARQRHSRRPQAQDRKSTRLNSSHRCISHAVFCLNKKKKTSTSSTTRSASSPPTQSSR